jgi:hypothetical protein
MDFRDLGAFLLTGLFVALFYIIFFASATYVVARTLQEMNILN